MAVVMGLSAIVVGGCNEKSAATASVAANTTPIAAAKLTEDDSLMLGDNIINDAIPVGVDDRGEVVYQGPISKTPMRLSQSAYVAPSTDVYKNQARRVTAAAAAVEKPYTINYLPQGRWNVDQTAQCMTFPNNVKPAIEAAASIWAGYLNSPIKLRIDACWTFVDGGLAQASGFYASTQVSGTPKKSVLYPVALRNALEGKGSTQSDMQIDIASDVRWYLGLDGRLPANQADMVTASVHEIGHGLGMKSDGVYDYGNGYWYKNQVYDHFLVDKNGKSLKTYPNNSKLLGDVFKSGVVWFGGKNALAANGAKPIAIDAFDKDPDYADLSHLDAGNLLMSSFPPLVLHNPDKYTIGILRDLGWDRFAVPLSTKIISPSGQSSNAPLYSWDRINAADFYYLLLKNSAGQTFLAKELTSSACSGETCSFRPSGSLPRGTYSWTIQTRNTRTGVGNVSNKLSFTVK